MTRLGDDSGVVAIIVALSISTFLLGFAALAVDLGVAYARKAQLQSAADRLAVATAQALPATTGTNTDGTPGAQATFVTQWTRLCQGGGDAAGAWPASLCPSTGWAFDRDRTNGQVEFLDDSDGGLTYDLPTSPGALPASATAVRVDLPPSVVPFGFAAAFGSSSTSVQKAASARIGTPLGAGILPFPIGEGEVNVGQVCVTDQKVDPAKPKTWTPVTTGSSPRADVASPTPATEPYDEEYTSAAPVPVTLRLTMNSSYPSGQTSGFKIRIGTSPDDVVPISIGPRLIYFDLAGLHRYYDITFDVPYQAPGTVLDIWVTGRHRKGGFGSKWVDFESLPGKLTFLGRPLNDDPCALPQATGRGYAPMARTSASDQLARNIRSGPQSQLYTEGLLGGLLDPLIDSCLLNSVQVLTGCLTSAKTDDQADEIRDGLLTSGDGRSGRLVGDCGNGTTSSNGYGGIDASRLVNSGSNLVDPKFGSGLLLRKNIVNDLPPKPGWVTAKALRCPRMAVLPVVSDTLAAPASGVIGRQITGFVYFWIDGITTDRGLDWGTGGQLRSLTGYVIKPEYLPSVVAGSGVVGPYLGDGMPKEATLICDLGDRKEGRCA